jgi:hypothetical protein
LDVLATELGDKSIESDVKSIDLNDKSIKHEDTIRTFSGDLGGHRSSTVSCSETDDVVSDFMVSLPSLTIWKESS